MPKSDRGQSRNEDNHLDPLFHWLLFKQFSHIQINIVSFLSFCLLLLDPCMISTAVFVIRWIYCCLKLRRIYQHFLRKPRQCLNYLDCIMLKLNTWILLSKHISIDYKIGRRFPKFLLIWLVFSVVSMHLPVKTVFLIFSLEQLCIIILYDLLDTT